MIDDGLQSAPSGKNHVQTVRGWCCCRSWTENGVARRRSWQQQNNVCEFFVSLFSSVGPGTILRTRAPECRGPGRLDGNKKWYDQRSRLCYLVTPAMRGTFDVAADIDGAPRGYYPPPRYRVTYRSAVTAALLRRRRSAPTTAADHRSYSSRERARAHTSYW